MTTDRRIAILNTTYGSFYCFENDLITEQLVKYGAHTRNEPAMVLRFIRQVDAVLPYERRSTVSLKGKGA